MIHIIVHGGAWNIPDDIHEKNKISCQRAAHAGFEILKRRGSALDAVEQAIVLMEEDGSHSAGIGSFLNKDGEMELDAAIMDGRTLKAGAVASVRNVRNPIRLARKVYESSQMMIVGAGAEEFARKCKLAVDPKELAQLAPPYDYGEEFMKQHDTVGAIALDDEGNLVVGSSTGGLPLKVPGRVGDSPLIGCGFYADHEVGAATCTGEGEAIMRVAMARLAVEFLSKIPAQKAAEKSIEVLGAKGHGVGGLILMDAKGNFGWAHNTPRMVVAHLATD
ncbi:isoaspartyl peptidase/L-asparaginase [Candidatus Acetothermia bacterium]|nr:isoaspartyl peptidase/L-asparaginase [Candidatus Acetothermia bacterium]MBI3461070.1 isoaspartyl peptidase/L-asparaginase [Candidatus Acetothermia bacterium]